MDSGKKILRIVIRLGIALLQLIMTQVVTLLASFLLPDIENFPSSHSAFFALILGITFTTGVFLTGLVAIKLGWLKIEPLVAARLAATLAGAYIPLVIALVVYSVLEAGNPFFFVAEITSILGFYIPGWVARKTARN
jgi:hypothetical protein